MSKSFLRVRNAEYELNEVILRIKVSKHGEGLITFDLFADSHESLRAGVAINAMTVKGATANDIANTTFELDENGDDALNELRESVICEPGTVLELSHLKVAFAAIRDGR